MGNLSEAIRGRHSERVAFDPARAIAESDLEAITEAARWAPTAHNMQNFEIVIVDDAATLASLARVRTAVSAQFVRENYAQLSFSEDELIARGTGLLASGFPPSWLVQHPGARHAASLDHRSLGDTMRGCPLVLVVVYDTRKRAPASPGDVLGLISLGCVLENMWLAATDRGIGLQVMSAFSGSDAEPEIHRILSLPAHLRIAFACRLGYPAAAPSPYLRVRRGTRRFTHRNRYDSTGV